MTNSIARYICPPEGSSFGGSMIDDDNGDYVEYYDYAELAEQSAAQAARIEQLESERNEICDAFQIGSEARTRSVLSCNIANVIHRSKKLGIIERHFEDGEGYGPIHWGMNQQDMNAALPALVLELRSQGIKYARNRLIASFTHGFLDKPESEVRDICRMLDDAASELKNEVSDDWLSETFGDEFLAAPLGVQQDAN